MRRTLPTLLPRMGDLLFSSWDTWIDPGMDRFLSGEAERWASGAADSGSEARADAGSRRLHAVVRPGFGQRAQECQWI